MEWYGDRCGFFSNCCIFVSMICLSFGSTAADIVFPHGFHVKNAVTDYHADPADNAKDDSDSLQKAINRSVGFHGYQYLYLPNGTYNISKTLVWRRDTVINGTRDSGLECGMHIIGQSREGVILKLGNSSSGFDSPGSPKAVLYTHSGDGTGNGNSGFRNHVSNLTIQIGSGNRGAVGIDFLGNNVSGISDVTIKTSDSGYAGIYMHRGYPGPALVKNVTVEGFRYGIVATLVASGITFENILLKNPTIAAVSNQGNSLFFRNLETQNAPTAIQNGQDLSQDVLYQGFSVIDSSRFLQGRADSAAIDNTCRLFVRNSRAKGYSTFVKNSGTPDPTVYFYPGGPDSGYYYSQYLQGGVEFSDDAGKRWSRRLFPTASRTLALPVEATPSYFDSDTTHWVNVQDSGAVPNTMEDCSGPINKALASGFSTIYFPPGSYHVKDSLLVTGAVRHIIGNGAIIAPWGAKFDSASRPKPVFHIATGLQNDIRIEHIDIGRDDKGSPAGQHPGAIFINHASSKTLTLARVRFMPKEGSSGPARKIKAGYQSAAGAGKLFIEDVASHHAFSVWRFSPGQKIWARQFNVEGDEYGGTNIVNDSADLWIFGLKSENEQTVVETKHNGRTELLGGFVFSSHPVTRPAFINDESHVSLSYFQRFQNYSYDSHVQETRSGTTKTLYQTDLPRNGTGVWNILYGGYKPEAATIRGCDMDEEGPLTDAVRCLLE
jgi:hypothetical protein